MASPVQRRYSRYGATTNNEYKSSITFNPSLNRVTIKREENPRLEATIMPSSAGIRVEMLGEYVQTNNGRPTGGKYPVRWTIPGEASDERIVSIITSAFSDYQYIERGLEDRIKETLKRVLPHRGHMDPDRKEIPEKFFEVAPDDWLKRGLKSASKEGDPNDRSNTGAANWCLDIYTSQFFRNTQDTRDRLNNDEFGAIFKAAAQDRIGLDTAMREMRKQNQLKVHMEIKEGIKACFKAGILREKIWSYRNWDKIVPHFDWMLESGMLTSKNLNAFVAQGGELFLPVLRRHSSEVAAWPAVHPKQAEIRDKFLEMLSRWPKTDRMASLLDSAFNYGVPMEMLVERKIMKPGELENLVDLAQTASRSRYKSKTLNATYKPPSEELVDLKTGWVWANSNTFRRLGDYYGCCISDSDYYERYICDGQAHVLFLDDRSAYPGKKGTQDEITDEERYGGYAWDKPGKGCLAFIALQNGVWVPQEVRAFANRDPHKQFKNEVERVCNELTRTHPRPFPIVNQNPEELKELGDLEQFQADKGRIAQERPNVQMVGFTTDEIRQIIGIERTGEAEEEEIIQPALQGGRH